MRVWVDLARVQARLTARALSRVGGRLPLWKQVHFKDKKPVHDLAPVSLASVDDEDIRPRAADVAPLEKLPLWAAVHMKRKAEMNAAPMWQRVRSGREATSSSGPVATPIGEPPSSDHAGPVQAAVVAAPPPLWQTVHEDGKRLPEPFLWRMAMRKLDNWGPASEEVVVTPTSADDDDADSPEGTATGQREELQRHAAGDDAPRPAAQMVLIPEEQAEASTPPTAAAAAAAADGAEGGAAEGGGEPPLWLRVHRQRRRSDAGFFIVGAGGEAFASAPTRLLARSSLLPHFLLSFTHPPLIFLRTPSARPTRPQAAQQPPSAT